MYKEFFISKYRNNISSSIIQYKDLISEISDFKCGSYRLPLSFKDKFWILFIKLFINSLPLAPIFINEAGIPIKWQLLLSYLYKYKISRTQSFEDGYIENGFLPGLSCVRLYSNNDNSNTGGIKKTVLGMGVSENLETAMSKAVGELLERVFLSRYFLDIKESFSIKDLINKKKVFFNPSELNGFLSFQKEKDKRLSFNDGTKFYWTKCNNLLSNEEVLLPTQIIFWAYDHKKAEEECVLGPSTTSGSGAFFSKKKAILSAIYEAVQRDAVLIYWLNLLSPNIIANETIPDQFLKENIAFLNNLNIDIFFLDVTSDICIPTIVCVMLDRNENDVSIHFAAASGFDTIEVLKSAFFECRVIHQSFINDSPFLLDEETYIPFISNEINKRERILFWRGEKAYEKFKFFLSGERKSYDYFMKKGRFFNSEDCEYSYVLNLFRNKGDGYEIYTYMPKNKILDDLGYHVAKVVIPRLIPLYLLESLATVNAVRLKEVPELLGHKSSDKLNPWPHPIP